MAEDLPARSPMQDLAEAIGTLERLVATHSRHPKHELMVNWIEAELSYVLDPTKRLILSPKDLKGRK